MVGKTQERGLTLVPTRIYFSGRAGQGRDRAGAAARTASTSASRCKARDQKRDMERALHERS